jgi:hypothetical protein
MASGLEAGSHRTTKRFDQLNSGHFLRVKNDFFFLVREKDGLRADDIQVAPSSCDPRYNGAATASCAGASLTRAPRKHLVI